MSTIPGIDIEQRLPAGEARDRVSSTTKIKNWRVLHACEYARHVLPVVEGQVSAGMRPYIVTPYGAGAAELYLSNQQPDQPANLSLLRAWHDVRNWRKSLLECDPENSADLVHAHSFAAGMAAVRGFSCVVYDVEACIEDWAIASGQCDHGSWMARSFRVAEQFIVSRAEAVVVNSVGMKSAVEERGAPSEAIFLVPEPVEFEPEIPNNNSFFSEDLKIPADATVYFVPQFVHEKETTLSAPALVVLEAFALLVAQVPKAKLLVGAPKSTLALLSSHVERLGIREHVLAVEPGYFQEAMRNADVVIAIEQVSADAVEVRQPNRICLDGLRLGKPLLAADVARNREASADGRGCLWFNSDDARDLSHRMAFLESNPNFRLALGASGKAAIVEARNSAAVARKCDEAYRYAALRKRARSSGPNITTLRPVVSANW